ncbi:MAG: hypothetical protein U1F06_05895 [Steroidobacteraceae bacterium]
MSTTICHSGSWRAWRRIATCLVAAALLQACVIVPYRPAATTRVDPAAIADAGRLALGGGPEGFAKSLARDVRAHMAALQPADGRAFLDAVAPGRELVLAGLLDPAMRPRIEPLGVDYLVLFGAPVNRTISRQGDMVLGLGFVGALRERHATSWWTAVIDLHRLEVLGQSVSESRGTTAAVGAFYGLFIAGDTDASARDDAVRTIAAILGRAHPTGTAHVAFLAVEPIPTAAELAAQARRAERDRVLHADRWSADLPAFVPSPAPSADEALVYLYRPATARVPPPWILEFSTGPDARPGRVAAVVAGGYHALRVPPGELRLAVAAGVAGPPRRSISLRAEPGQTYFVRAMVHAHLLGANELALAPTDAARGVRELDRCRRMPSSREYDGETRRRADYGSEPAQLELAALLRAGTRYADGGSLGPDPQEAYTWLAIARQRAAGPAARVIAREQAALAAAMDAGGMAEAEQHAREWLEDPEHARP